MLLSSPDDSCRRTRPMAVAWAMSARYWSALLALAMLRGRVDFSRESDIATSSGTVLNEQLQEPPLSCSGHEGTCGRSPRYGQMKVTNRAGAACCLWKR